MDNNTENLTKRERRQLRREEKTHSKDQSARIRLAKKISMWAIGLVLIVGGIFGLVRLGSQGGGTDQTASLLNTVNPTDWVQGSSTAKTVLVEYSDFQCPACKAFYSVVEELAAKYPDNLKIAYRYFPLRQVHKNADLSARAAEAAGKQGKFWEMHDSLFEHQEDWAESDNAKDTFITYATTLNLNIDQFKTDIDSASVKSRVDKDLQDGLNSGVNSTPTFFLNGKRLNPPSSFDDFRNQIETTIATAH